MNNNLNNPLISVIVPVYMVEKYINRCVDSIISQTYTNLQILLIDDGSPDNCGLICDQYARIDNRVEVFHKSNGGLASARNFGVKYAKGDYISFVDSDDWIEKNTFEDSINILKKEKNKVDIIQFGIKTVSDYNEYTKKNKEKITKLQGKEILNHLMIKSTKTDSYFAVGRCLYLASLIKKEEFPVGRINEDIVYKYRVFSKASYLIETNKIKYFYYQNYGSITNDGLKKRDFDLYIAAEELKKLTNAETYGKIKKLGEVKYSRCSLSLLCKIAFYGVADPNISKEETVKSLQIELRQNYKKLLFSSIPFSR